MVSVVPGVVNLEYYITQDKTQAETREQKIRPSEITDRTANRRQTGFTAS